LVSFVRLIVAFTWAEWPFQGIICSEIKLNKSRIIKGGTFKAQLWHMKQGLINLQNAATI